MNVTECFDMTTCGYDAGAGYAYDETGSYNCDDCHIGFDKESNLHQNGARDYDPLTGRYREFDPLGLAAGINGYSYVENNPLALIDPEGLSGRAPGSIGGTPTWGKGGPKACSGCVELCTRSFYPIPIPYAQHCFVRFGGSGTFSYDPSGTRPDPAPNWWPKSCSATGGDQSPDCVKREMQRCQASQYDFTGFNCCHCVEQAFKACGISVPRGNWPNWPVNPGPRPGEPGYKP